MTTGQSGHDYSLAIRQEIQRFESVHPSIYAIYDLIDLISDTHIAKQIREHVVAIEGTPIFTLLIKRRSDKLLIIKLTRLIDQN